MKILKIMLATLALAAIVATTFGCSSPSNQDTSQNQIATVQRGNLTLDITAAGNLALSRTEDLVFDLFYQKGTVAEVTVAEGDTVKEGQVLASLDASEWDDQIRALEDALSTAQRLVTTKERALATAQRLVTAKERALTASERQVTAEEFAQRQAELDLETAQYNLNAIDEVKEQQDLIYNYEYRLQFIDAKISESLAPGANALDHQYWVNEKARVNTALAAAQQELSDILSGHSLTITTDVAIEVARKQLAVETAQMSLEDAAQAIADARTAVDDARTDLENAKVDVSYAQADLETASQNAADAQKALDEAKAASPEIKAPFDGFVTTVNVAGGDEVLKGTVAIQLADPDKFEADILVNEMDIPQVKLGGEAQVSIDAMSGVSLPAVVTHIAPTATIQSGVVNYTVKVEVESSASIALGQPANQPATTDNLTGQLPTPLQRAVDSGRMTQEQAEQMIAQGPPEDFTPPEGFTLPDVTEFAGTSGSQAKSQLATTIAAAADFQLRQGLTVTVSIIVAERTDVLLVPNAAVTKEGTQSYVQVVTASGAAEKRAVKTGLSDWQNTEITEGLTEGEQVLVPQTTTSTTSQSDTRGGMGFLGPIGR